VVGVSHTTWDLSSTLAATGGFVLAAALWWTYFDFIDSSMVQRSKVAGLVFTYAHYPLTLGIASLGVGVELAVLSSGGEGGHEGTDWLLGVGVAVCMAAMALIQLATPPTLVDAAVVLRVASAVAAALLVPLSFVVPAAVSLWLLAGVTLLVVCIEVLGDDRRTAVP
jgi:low temperature requirement protein LtrA